MTQNSIKKIKEKIHKDGSLTEEKKNELLNLLETMNPETTKSSKDREEYAQRMTKLSTCPVFDEMRQKITHQHF